MERGAPGGTRSGSSFSLEFHRAGGNCWVLEEGLARQYRFHDNAEFVRDHWIVGEDAILALAYGRFRRYVDALDGRERLTFAHSGKPLWRFFDGVRLVEHRDGRATELVRYVRA